VKIKIATQFIIFWLFILLFDDEWTNCYKPIYRRSSSSRNHFIFISSLPAFFASLLYFINFIIWLIDCRTKDCCLHKQRIWLWINNNRIVSHWVNKNSDRDESWSKRKSSILFLKKMQFFNLFSRKLLNYF
jgi:hypothetical protein